MSAVCQLSSGARPYQQYTDYTSTTDFQTEQYAVRDLMLHNMSTFSGSSIGTVHVDNDTQRVRCDKTLIYVRRIGFAKLTRCGKVIGIETRNKQQVNSLQ